jgi:hypothetical protein
VRNLPEARAMRERAEAELRQPSIAEQWTAPLPKDGEQSPEQQAREDAIAAQAAAEIDAGKEALWRRARAAGCDRRVFDEVIWPKHRLEPRLRHPLRPLHNHIHTTPRAEMSVSS